MPPGVYILVLIVGIFSVFAILLIQIQVYRKRIVALQEIRSLLSELDQIDHNTDSDSVTYCTHEWQPARVLEQSGVFIAEAPIISPIVRA